MARRRLLAAAAVACACALPGLAHAGGGAPHVLLGDFAAGPAPASVVDALAADEARRDAKRPHVQPTAADRLRAERLLAEAARLDRR